MAGESFKEGGWAGELVDLRGTQGGEHVRDDAAEGVEL